MGGFDQIEFEQELKNCTDARLVYMKGEHICHLYDKGFISEHVREECMDLVKDRLRILAALREQLK